MLNKIKKVCTSEMAINAVVMALLWIGIVGLMRNCWTQIEFEAAGIHFTGRAAWYWLMLYFKSEVLRGVAFGVVSSILKYCYVY